MSLLFFLAGIRMATFAAAGVFFLKFWKASRDRFFLLFCIACWLLALECVVISIMNHSDRSIFLQISETSAKIYLIRLCAFIVILAAVIEKNRAMKKL
jgi:hypothetical protein